ncbi:MAG: type II toxin-antitoxin system VapC family toxin [Bacteroidales bacterium]|jgi:predicted nucleic acid-binding protein|nr:type II toxin-antitoxin system VapC family toxin [Bacteroidales bacterium]
MTYILDTSFVGAMIIPDENDREIEKLHDTINSEDVRYAPQLLWYEIANIFKNLIRRKRFTRDRVIELMPYLETLDITTDFESGVNYSQKLLRLSSAYDINSYDAAYLELAERKKAVLCTLDSSLKIAAKKHGIKVLGA